MKRRKIYVASSWRNPIQPDVVLTLRAHGHSVYDFRNPGNGLRGFAWSDIDPKWKQWDARKYRDALQQPRAEEGFAADFEAMQWADTFVLVWPCGRSAHLEAGWACGAGKETFLLLNDDFEPELMVKMMDHICGSVQELAIALALEPATHEVPAP